MELTESQIVVKFVELQSVARCLGLRLECERQFNICYNDSAVAQYKSLNEVEMFLLGYKLYQAHYSKNV